MVQNMLKIILKVFFIKSAGVIRKNIQKDIDN